MTGRGMMKALAISILMITACAALFLATRDRAPPSPPEGGSSEARDAPAAEAQAAAAPPVAPAASETREASVHGKVTRESGTPVPGVWVHAVPCSFLRSRFLPADPRPAAGGGEAGKPAGPEPSTDDILKSIASCRGGKTDEAGSYRIEGIPPGSAKLMIRDGDDLFDPGREISLQSGEEREENLVLRTLLAISGRVLDPDGGPLCGVVVRAQLSVYGGGGSPWRRCRQAQVIADGGFPDWRQITCRSGAGGAFVLQGLEPLTYSLRAEAAGYLPGTAPHVPAGADGLEVRLGRGARMTGRVALPRKGEVAGLSVLAARSEDSQELWKWLAGGPSAESVSGHRLVVAAGSILPSGGFEIAQVPPGLLTALAWAPGFLPCASGSVRVKEGSTVDVGILSLQSATRISGRITGKDDRPLGGASVMALPEGWGRLRGESSALARIALSETRSEEDGRYVVPGLVDGKYDVRAWAADHAPEVKEGVASGSELDFRLGEGVVLGGRVLDATDGRPVAQARVWALGTPAISVSDGQGRFRLCGIPQGSDALASQLWLAAEAPGYQDAMDMLALAAGAGESSHTLYMRPGWRIEGRVVTPEGRPLSGARVRVLLPGVPSSVLPPAAAPVEISGSEGDFTLVIGPRPGQGGDLKPEIVASHPDYADARSGPLDFESLKASPRRVELVLEKGGRIEGHVRETSGEPVGGARVSIRFPPAVDRKAMLAEAFGVAERLQAAWSQGDGSFSISRVAAGDYLVDVERAGFAPAGLPVKVEGGTQQIDLVLDEKSFVSGTVLDISGRPVESARVSALRHESAFPPAAYDLEAMVKDGLGEMSVLTRGDGKFRLEPVPDAPCILVARADGHEAGALSGVTANSEGNDIVLKPLSSIAGVVTSARTGLPVAGFVTSLTHLGSGSTRTYMQHPWNRSQSGERSFATGDGRFLYPSVPAGTFRLLVRAPGFAPLERQVEALPGEEAQVQVALAPGFELTGLIQDDDGDPVGGARVNVSGVGEPGGRALDALPGMSRPDGGFSVKGLGEGTYEISVRHDAYLKWKSKPLHLEADLDYGVVPLKRGAVLEVEITGIPRGPEGLPTWPAVKLEAEGAQGSPGFTCSLERAQEGRYRGTSIPPGTYTIAVRLQGYTDARYDPLQLESGEERKHQVPFCGRKR